ncbi:MAG TPA: amidohydrolase family protein [Candidatus Pullichristensenella excrementigallinarum]|uniref:Amidohydrolase family protein n=1 Tax=Candidatus Pullichristensenella excrementigallinarum TaxID=2840907 RepID=A0A9D1IAR0_9FIRM|nr:amidohydrolase family protein [Candidatus Pullichristensenella excrementigallinarum]
MITIQSKNVWLDGEYRPATISIHSDTGRIERVTPGLCPDAENALESAETYVLPGLIDCHTHAAMGGPGGDRIGDQNDPKHFDTPFFRAIDATDPFHACYAAAEKAGFTMVAVLPGSYCVVGGQVGLVLTGLRDPFGRIVAENVGMKVALGARPKMAAEMAGGKSPQTKMAVYAMLRESLLRARRNRQEDSGARDLGTEGWSKVLDKQAPLRVHCHRADDILKALRFGEEMDVNIVLEHATGALELAEEIAARKIPVVCTNTILRVPQLSEETCATEHYAAELMRRGVPVALSTNFPEVAWDAIRIQACECLRCGAPYRAVIDALTLVPAKIVGMEAQTGSIEEGKWADLSFWTGEYPRFETQPLGVMIHGEWRGRGGRA